VCDISSASEIVAAWASIPTEIMNDRRSSKGMELGKVLGDHLSMVVLLKAITPKKNLYFPKHSG